MRRPSRPNREATISWMGECIPPVRSLKTKRLCLNVLGFHLKKYFEILSAVLSSEKMTECMCVCAVM